MRIRELVSKKTEGYEPASFTGSTGLLGPDNVVSPVGSVPKSQQINIKKVGKNAIKKLHKSSRI